RHRGPGIAAEGARSSPLRVADAVDAPVARDEGRGRTRGFPVTIEGSPVTDVVAAPSFATFAIGFDPRDRARVMGYWQEIFASNRWTEGEFTKRFEQRWAEWNGLPAVAMSSW